MAGPSSSNATRALRCSGLVKRYGDVAAVAGLDLEVHAGECFGMLGPNGAGKTTTVEIFEGLRDARRRRGGGARRSVARRRPGAARAARHPAAGDEVPGEAERQRGRGAVPQLLSARARASPTLSRSSGWRRRRAAHVRTLSGGQKQRLSLGCALVGDPELLFLDEPTTGLDPQSRRQTWEIVEALKARGRTVLLTTHYMEEAARLCDRVAVVDHGKVIALGTPRELIASLGAEHVIEFAVAAEHADARRRSCCGACPSVEDVARDGGSWRLTVREVHRAVPALLRRSRERGAEPTELTTHHATLEDVFMALTGRRLRDG